MDRQTHRTIHVAYRNHSRLARIRLRRPHPSSPRPLLSARITALFPALRVPDEPTHYTPELALELLAGTSELPENKHALFSGHQPPCGLCRPRRGAVWPSACQTRP